MEYCGIDAHSKSSTVCVIDSHGKKLMLDKTPSTKDGLIEKVGGWDAEMPIIVEACSASRPVLKYLKEMGFENVTVVNPSATAQMRSRGKKTDYVDALGLAELSRLGLSDAWKVHIAGEWAQNMRDLLYEREFVIKHRVALVNRVKALFRREGKIAPSLKGQADWIKLTELLPNYESQLSFFRDMNAKYLERESELTKAIKYEAQKHPQHKLVNTVPHVGPLTAASILACIDDISRFKSSKALASYFGIAPTVFQTGTTERTGSITKRGNALARKFLAQAAHHSRYSSSPFNAVYRDLVNRKGTAIAVMAVARKIITSIYAVMKYNEPFDPVKMGLIKVDEEIKVVRAYKRANEMSRK